MIRRAVAAAAATVLLLGAGCRREAAGPAGSAGPLAKAQRLVEQGRYDDAVALVGSRSEPEALYLLGRAWMGKAQTAPVPTPVPGSTTPSGALLKVEEEQALGFLERALAAQPDHAGAQLALAELLAPHALALASAHRRAGTPGPAGAPDLSVDRVLRAYQEASEADPAGTSALEGLIRFASAVGRLVEAGGAYQELVRRRREDPDVLVRYGDFLAGPGGDPEAALSQYAQSLIWRADDTKTRVKMADIHLAAARALLAKRQYVAAEARLRDARRFVVDPASPQAALLAELEGRLREIRGR